MDTGMTDRERLDKPRLARRLGRHPVSIDRYVRDGLLPAPHRFLGRQFWFLDEIVAAEAKLAAMPPGRARRGGAELAASGRAAKKLRAAAAAALEVGGISLVAQVLAPFTATGRLEEIPSEKRFDAAAALIAAVAEVRGTA